MTGTARRGTLHLVTAPPSGPVDGQVVVVDPVWTPVAGSAAAALPVRDVMDRVLAELDPIEETSRLLDNWARRSGVIETLTIGSTSFWYYARLRHWMWLQDRVLWAAVVRRLIDDTQPLEIVCDPGADQALLDVVAVVAAEGGPRVRDEPVDPGAGGARPAVPRQGSGSGARRGGAALAVRTRVPVVVRRLGARVARLAGASRRWATPVQAPGGDRPARDFIDDRLDRLAGEDGRRLLVVVSHVPQRIETPDGVRWMNPYLGPVIDQLRGTRLDPIVLNIRAWRSDPATAGQLTAPDADRVLPADAVRDEEVALAPEIRAQAVRRARSIGEATVPAIASGIDLGPMLAREVSASAVRWFPRRHLEVQRMGRLLERLPIAGIVVAVEYHRQETLEAARMAGVPVIAIQHGTIYRRHNGYIHDQRPPVLHLPDRTYVFGRWARDLLVHQSVYREDEVLVTGSPRLDLYRPEDVDRDAVRAACGVAPGDRLLVVSGTYGHIYRRFHYPVVLARLFDRPMPNVHVVVKQHPAERDEGPYRAVIEGVAAARGFAPPPITLVQHVDLYQLLAAADAHLGVHSTVLTEAVFVGTANLLAAGVLGGDLLDYVVAGVARPVSTGGDVLAALEIAADGIPAAARAAFVEQHFEPGPATERIVADLLATIR